SIMEQFNPALENLVYLGNNYLRAFHALSEAAEVYFSAIQKIGERALQSPTSQILGEILVQMSDTQRHLNSDLEVVVSIRLQGLKRSLEESGVRAKERAHLPKSLRSRVPFWVPRIQGAVRTWLTPVSPPGQARGMLQNRVLLWKEQSEASRSPSRAHSPGLLGPGLGPPYPSGRLTPTRLDMPPRPLGEFSSPRSRHGSGSYGPEPSARPASQLEPDRRSLPRTPSASSLYSGSTQSSRSNSFGERPGGGGGARRVRALVSHSEGANHTLLRFSAGDVVEVLVPEAQNGWLYGKLEGSSASGWFPEAYVKALEEGPVNPMTPMTPMMPVKPGSELPSRSYPLRGSHSLDDLLDRPGNSTAPSEYWDGQSRSRTPSRVPSRAPSPAPPPLPSNCRGSMGSTGTATDVKKLMSSGQSPPQELFPRGTNPFATVKLRPTITNDRSAPLIR
uniref:BAR/IMD domain containing adaptor protein 2 like 2 n=1 Tax=Papio anubis TaxID=9555 RepID=A0A8I5NBP6_PAPAN